jgi:hypothetical protein
MIYSVSVCKTKPSQVEHDLDRTPAFGTGIKSLFDIRVREAKAVCDQGLHINKFRFQEIDAEGIRVAIAEHADNIYLPAKRFGITDFRDCLLLLCMW